MTDCVGIELTDDDQIICRCCGDFLGIWTGFYDDDTYEVVTPSGTCWACGLGVCPQHCANYQPTAEEAQPTANDLDRWDLETRIATPCPECGELGACAYDAEGRPMIHVEIGASDG